MGGQAEDAETEAVEAVRFDPVVQEMEGWTVHVDPALLSGAHAEEGKKPYEC